MPTAVAYVAHVACFVVAVKSSYTSWLVNLYDDGLSNPPSSEDLPRLPLTWSNLTDPGPMKTHQVGVPLLS